MRFAEHFISFSQEFDNFNNTGVRMLVSIYHMPLKLLLKRYFWLNNATVFSSFT